MDAGEGCVCVRCKGAGGGGQCTECQRDLEQQKKQINYFIDKGMDVIVIICIDSEGLAEQVQKAKEAGIKVIAYDQ